MGGSYEISDKNVANRRPVGCGRKNEGSYNRPYSRYPPSLHALKNSSDQSDVMWFLRGQTSAKFFQYKKSRSIFFLFLTTGNEHLFLLKTIIANYGVEVISFSFLDAAAAVDVLTGINNDVNFFETQTCSLHDH